MQSRDTVEAMIIDNRFVQREREREGTGETLREKREKERDKEYGGPEDPFFMQTVNPAAIYANKRVHPL